MRLKQWIFILPLLAAGLLFPSEPALAAKKYTTEVTNSVEMGQVAIRLDEFEKDRSGNLVPYVDGKVVVPGQKVSNVVRITNLGNVAWLRVKPEYNADDGIHLLSDADITLANSKWIKRGDYYYYTEPVPTNGYVDFINEVTIPREWTEDAADNRFGISFSTDAVQERNFTPVFDSDDPWFGTPIEERVYVPFEIKASSSDAFSVEFRNNAEGFVRVGDDFFSNWPTILPGDTLTGEIKVGNNYTTPVEIFFYTENIADDDLLKQLRLTIKNGDTVIFEGPMSESVKRISLGRYKKGDVSKLTYSVYVPKELQNKYALSATKTKWIFEAELDTPYHRNSGGGGGGGSNRHEDPPTRGGREGFIDLTSNPTPPGVQNTPPVGQVIQQALARTGDDHILWVGILGMLVALGGIFFVLKKHRKES